MCVYDSLFICSSIDGYLDCSHLMAIMNTAAMNMGIHVNV